MKYFLTTNMIYPTPMVGGVEVKFYPAVYMHPTRSEWGTLATEDETVIDALKDKKYNYISEISEEDHAAYDVQRRNRVDYSTVFHIHHQGMSTDMKAGPAVVVDDPTSPLRVQVTESPDEILATKVSNKAKR